VRYQQPQQVVGADPKWVARGLRSAYSLAPGVWSVNQVTGRTGGALVGSGVTFVGGALRTPGVASNGATLEHGLALNITLPITLVVGWRRVSGAVSWSLLRNDAGDTWTGWYGEVDGTIKSTNSNSFDGLLALGGAGGTAFTHASGTSLYGASVAASATSAAASTPASVNASTVALGWARRGAGFVDNPAVADFTHFAAIQGALSISELQSLAGNPWQLFAAPKVARFAAAVGGVTVAPSKGSVALTGKIPAVTRTASVVIAPVKGAMALIGKLPTLAQTANQVVAPVKGSIAFTGKQATVFQSASGTIQASKGALTYAGKVPALLQTANVVLNPAKSLLSYSGHVATIAQTANQAIAPIKGALTYAGKLPTVTQIAGANIAPFGVSLSYAGKAPIVTRTTNQLFAPAKGVIIYKGYPPSILRSSALIASARRTAKLTGRNFGAALPLRNNLAIYDPSET
jgi:hypothetical protein